MSGLTASSLKPARAFWLFSLLRWSTRLSSVVAACSLGLGASPTFAGTITTYRGICNASAGIDLGSGHFVVADDDIDSLVVYRYDEPKRIQEVKVGTYLKGGSGGGGEADLEGAARIGDRIYWITSHSSKDSGAPRPNRQRLFVTRIDTSGGVPTVVLTDAKPYTGLLDALASDSRFKALSAATSKGAEMKGGLNIEGLAATAIGGLLIGFRNPLMEAVDAPNTSQALVLELKNPADVVEHGAEPNFGDLVQIDLGNRGVRSIERIGNEYFILAGPFDGGTAGTTSGQFAIYKWNGSPRSRPAHWKDVSPSNFHAEGMFEIAGTNRIYLVSDDGDENKPACKEGPNDKTVTEDKTFRGMAIDR